MGYESMGMSVCVCVLTECIIRRLGDIGRNLEVFGGEGCASSDAEEEEEEKSKYILLIMMME